jgi:CubicO group peptidase (beta-lactamase class C family)
VDNVAAAVVAPDGAVSTVGDLGHSFRLASITKVLTGWATLIAVEEGIVDLDQPVGQPGCTLRHLLAHAGGYAFDGPDPISPPERRRIYSNTGIELAAATVADAAGMPFDEYLGEAVLAPLGMTATALRGSPAFGCWSTVADVVRLVHELRAPRLLSAATARAATSVQFPALAGIVPGFGRFDPCPWGLGMEVRGAKSPHWTGTRNSTSTFGHFGGAGTVLWVDPGAAVACVALTDRPFDDWAGEARRVWPELADAVIDEVAG